ncbi:MAG: purine-nucleoside phosphorylase [Actinomycetota bacterium]|nr:MAG: purine-nucleoside phosphorylase [Actinomycetota bacterium]
MTPSPDPVRDPPGAARAAAAAVAAATGQATHDIAVVLGSGWGAAADPIGELTAELPVDQLPGFARPAVGGHPGTVRSVRAADRRVLVFVGRTHLYEGHGVESVVHPVRTAVAAGCGTVILTNSAGSLDPSWPPGTLALIRDHINLTGASPLRGPAFLDLTDLYSAQLRRLCQQLDPTLADGVYVAFRGPQYETPAEIAMVRAIGGHLVGMSTALEAIAAREGGATVLGLSLVSNLAAGLTGGPVDHAEVLAAGAAAAGRAGELLARLVLAVPTGHR